tara:strand:+ start:117 stop:722 length:606 start_codon:yes stop_codon:yes gene_type:complete
LIENIIDIYRAVRGRASFDRSPLVEGLDMNQRMQLVLALALSLLSGCGESGNQSAPLYSMADSVALSSKVDNVEAYGDGSPNEITTYTYNEQGDPLTLNYDINADGKVDRRYTYSYGPEGNLLAESYDTDADGTADRNYIYSYDESGRLLTVTRDTDGDGSANEISQYNRDSNGVLISQSCDDDADGKADRIVELGHCGYL